MDWSDVVLKIPTQYAETACAIAQLLSPGGIYIEDYSDLTTEAPKIAHIDLIDEELLAKDRAHVLVHLYVAPAENPSEAVSFLQSRLDAAGVPHTISLENVRELDWATAWKQYYHPTKVGRRLVVRPTWEAYAPAEDEVVIDLDPGMAFGTGTHETTRLCMQLLEDCVDGNTTMLDVGTGSGILAIAALKLGAATVTACDIDSTAVRVAAENAALNGVEGKIHILCGDLAQQVQGRFDVVCANIVADIIIRLAPDVPRFLKPDGVFLASGIIDEREQDVRDALAGIGLAVTDARRQGGWVALACRFAGKAGA